MGTVKPTMAIRSTRSPARSGPLGPLVVQIDKPLRNALASCRDLIISVACFSAMLNLLYIAPSIYMLQVYDRVVPTRGGLTLLFLTIILTFAITTVGLLDFARSRLLVRASARIERTLITSLMAGMFDAHQVNRQKTSALVREFDNLRQILSGIGILAICDIPWTPIYVLICFLLHPLLGAFALVCGLILLAVTWSGERAAKAAATSASTSSRNFYQALDASISGAETITALGMCDAVVKNHLDDRERFTLEQHKANLKAAKFVSTTKVARMLMQSLALGLGAYLAIEQMISAGAIFAASLLLSRALAPIESVTAAWRNLAAAQVAYTNLNGFLAAAQATVVRTQLPTPRGLIEVEQLSVASPERTRALIQGITLRVDPGETLGIVGPSGAGKSTLIRALAGLLPAHIGSIRVDGAKIEDWDREQLARSIGYLPQASPLFTGSVKDNITRFQTKISPDTSRLDAEAVEVASLCGVHEMILGLPNAYETRLGAGGMQLSTGQSQQIALCRALYGAPSILLFDEPNAGLDSNAEAALVSLIALLKTRGVTIVLAAHQLRLFESCDKLAVMKEGKLLYFGEKRETILRLGNAMTQAA
jgi:PrtD family type I secretion system ABC transporter